MSKRASQVLQEARALIDAPEKWCRSRRSGCAAEYAGRACLREATGLHGDAAEAAERLLDWAAGVEGEDPYDAGALLCAWSADPARTHAEVLDAFDVAISLARSDEEAL